MYFGNYRFSQDLDFSTLNIEKIKPMLSELIKKACDVATDKIQDLGENIEIISEQYTEKKPHPEGQQVFTIKARMPWQRDFHTTVYAEISFQEIVILPPNAKDINHPYEEKLTGQILLYPLEEIVAEKVRALLQFAKKLHERGWARSRVRDYYDLWRIMKDFKDEVNFNIVPQLIKTKCDYKSVMYNGINGINDIFQDKLLQNVNNEWETWLSEVVSELPNSKEVINSLKEFFNLMIKEELN